jgi:hypothetical protein
VTVHCARCDRLLTPTGAYWRELTTHREICFRCAEREIERAASLRYVPAFKGARS